MSAPLRETWWTVVFLCHAPLHVSVSQLEVIVFHVCVIGKCPAVNTLLRLLPSRWSVLEFNTMFSMHDSTHTVAIQRDCFLHFSGGYFCDSINLQYSTFCSLNQTLATKSLKKMLKKSINQTLTIPQNHKCFCVIQHTTSCRHKADMETIWVKLSPYVSPIMLVYSSSRFIHFSRLFTHSPLELVYFTWGVNFKWK